MKKLLSILLLISMIASMAACQKNDTIDTTPEQTTETTEYKVYVDYFPRGVANSVEEYQEWLNTTKLPLPDNFITYDQLSPLGKFIHFSYDPYPYDYENKNPEYFYYFGTGDRSWFDLEIINKKKEYNFCDLGNELLLNMVGRAEIIEGYVELDLSEYLPDFNGIYIQNGVLYRYTNGKLQNMEWYSNGLTFRIYFTNVTASIINCKMLQNFVYGYEDCADPVKAFDEMLYGTQQP